MIRSGDEYRASIRDGREVWMNGERITDVTAHPAFKPLVDARARIYDMAHDPATSDLMSYQDADSGERHAVGLKLPHTREDWEQEAPRRGRRDGRPGRRRDPRRRRDGGRDVVAVRRPGRAERGRPAVLGQHRAPPAGAARRSLPRLRQHRPKGDRSKRPQTRTPTCCCTSSARPTTASSCAEPSTRPLRPMPTRPSSPTIANWGDSELSDYALGFICDMGAPASSTSAAPGSPAARRSRTTRCPTASTRWTRSA
jgi:4-hydroxyphenylacetate 3-monooxygenase